MATDNNQKRRKTAGRKPKSDPAVYRYGTTHGAAEDFYALLSDENRSKLVDRACLCYDGRQNLPLGDCIKNEYVPC